jgi:hypothetical protein
LGLEIACACNSSPEALPPAHAFDQLGHREALCRAEHAQVLALLEPADVSVLTAEERVVRERYLALASAGLAHAEAAKRHMDAALALERGLEGEVPLELAFVFGEQAYWQHLAVGPLFERVLASLESEPRGALEPHLLTIPGCARPERRTVAQARAFAHLRLGTLALHAMRCADSDRHFQAGIAELERAAQLPDRFEGTSYGALLYNNWSDTARACGEPLALAVARRETALRYALRVDAGGVAALAAAGLAHIGALDPKQERSAESLVVAAIAESGLRGRLGAGSAPGPALGAWLRAAGLRAWHEARFWGPASPWQALDTELSLSLLAAEPHPIVRIMVRYLFFRASAARGDTHAAGSDARAFLSEMSTVWTATLDAEKLSEAFATFEEMLAHTLAFAVQNQDPALALHAMEVSKDLALFFRYAPSTAPSAPAAAGAEVGPNALSASLRLPEPTALAELQARLEPGEVFVHLDFQSAQRELIRLIVTPDAATLEHQLLPQHVPGLRRWTHSATEEGASPPAEPAWASAWDASELLGGAWASLTPSAGLILSPRGHLHRVAWPTLGHGAERLVERAPSSVVPSATHFVKLRSRPSNLAKAPQRLLVGATDFDPSAEQAALRIPSRPDPELCHAPSDLAPSLPTSVLWVKAHGIFEPRAPTASYLRLRAEGRSDGKWTLEEIAQAGLQLDVVFLQACHGADATDAPGDQVDSVARAFIAGGARAVVAPLGEVDAQASQDLARAFRRQFAGGRSAAQALRLAQLELGGSVNAGAGERWPLYVLYGDGGVRAE